MKIVVVRHGQTDWNAIGKLQGQTDIELNDTGRMQAEKLRDIIKDENIDYIISSPLKRAKQTAQIINMNYQVRIIEDERIIERGYGKNEGLTKDEIKKLKKSIPEVGEVWNYNKNVGINDVEPVQDFFARVYSFLDEIIKKYSDKNILLVTHGGISIPIKCYFTKYPLEKLVDRENIKGLKNCEVIKFEI